MPYIEYCRKIKINVCRGSSGFFDNNKPDVTTYSKLLQNWCFPLVGRQLKKLEEDDGSYLETLEEACWQPIS
jgi:hypothetical protein